MLLYKPQVSAWFAYTPVIGATCLANLCECVVQVGKGKQMQLSLQTLRLQMEMHHLQR